MDLTVNQLLELDTLKNAKLIAGETNAHNIVKDIMVMEYMDIEKWMNPHQVLLTSLYGFNNFDEEVIRSFVKKVVDLNGAGIIVRIGRYFSKTPTLLVDICEEEALPLIEIPEDVKYDAIIFEITRLLYDEKNIELDYFYKSHEELMKLLNTNLTIEKTIHALSMMINRPILLYRNEEILYTTDNRFSEAQYLESLGFNNKLNLNFRRDLYEYPLVNKKLPTVILEFYTNQKDDYHLTIVENNEPLSIKEIMAIENASNLLKMQIINEINLQKLRVSMKRDLVDILLYDTSPNIYTKLQAIEELGLSSSKNYRLVFLNVPTIEEESEYSIQFLIDMFQTNFSRLIYKVGEHKIILALEMNAEKDFDDLRLEKKVQNIFSENYFNFVQNIVIGSITTIDQFSEQVGKLRETFDLVTKLAIDKFILFDHDIPTHLLIANYTKYHDTKELVAPDLFTLYKYHFELFETLKTYLLENQNVKKTSQKMYLHPKTISYRLSKIKEVIAIDFDKGLSTLKYLTGILIIDEMNASDGVKEDPL